MNGQTNGIIGLIGGFIGEYILVLLMDYDQLDVEYDFLSPANIRYCRQTNILTHTTKYSRK